MSNAAKKAHEFEEKASSQGVTGMIPENLSKTWSKDVLKMAENIFDKVEKAGGKAALQRCIESGGLDLPPIKLTTQEMEYIKGGASKGSPTFEQVCAGIGAATAIWGSIACSVT